MGWFATPKKKVKARLETLARPDQVYQSQLVLPQPCAPGPFVHGPAHPEYHHCPPPPNIVVNHYYVAAPGAPNIAHHVPDNGNHRSELAAAVSTLRLGSVVNLATDLVPMNLPRLFDDRPPTKCYVSGPTCVSSGAVLYDQLSSKFDSVMTSIDNDRFDGLEADLFSFLPCTSTAPTPALNNDSATFVPAVPNPPQTHSSKKKQPASASLLSSIKSGNYFAKVDLYANSRLPYDLPPMKLYIASYRLLSLAAKYSDRAYQQPQASVERHTHIDADWRAGTKAMVIKSVPMDDVNTIVFAIRGTANFMDWTVNLKTAPASPAGFLDDPGNLCHSGFLSTARKMVQPVALRLRQLLEEDPGRAAYSLLITGHSAGGAVASLLYSHMLATSTQAESELNLLTGCFRRVHCITFGTPPVSLLPLKTPVDRRELKRSLFYSFVNEGDPVVRADKAYVKSLIDLFATSVPPGSAGGNTLQKDPSRSPAKSSKPSRPPRPQKSRHGDRNRDSEHPPKPVWKVPQCSLSNAGRIIVLRSGNPQAGLAGKKTVEERLSEGVVAQFTSDEQLRGVVWGDPVCHVMKLYAGRIEALAIAAMMVDG